MRCLFEEGVYFEITFLKSLTTVIVNRLPYFAARIINVWMVLITQPRPQGFSLKKWVWPHPFFEGKTLGTRL